MNRYNLLVGDLVVLSNTTKMNIPIYSRLPTLHDVYNGAITGLQQGYFSRNQVGLALQVSDQYSQLVFSSPGKDYAIGWILNVYLSVYREHAEHSTEELT